MDQDTTRIPGNGGIPGGSLIVRANAGSGKSGIVVPFVQTNPCYRLAMPIVKNSSKRYSLTLSQIDLLILAHIDNPDVLSDMVQITPAQLDLVTQRPKKTQESDRALGNGPKAHPYGPRGETRYFVGEVRKFLKTLTPRNNTAEAVLAESDDLAVLMRMRFADFLDNAGPNDPWPFIVHDGVPIDFFKSLEMEPEDLSDEDTAAILTLDQYLSKRREAAWAREAAESGAEVRAYADAEVSQDLPSLKDLKPNGGRL